MSSLAPSTHALDARVAQRQRLPNETLTTILAFLEPWDVWPLRVVCHNFNAYIMCYLAPRVFLPTTTFFIRGEDSWIFVGANDDETSEIETPLTADGLSPSATVPPSSYDHRGRKLSFLSTRALPAPVTPPVSPSGSSSLPDSSPISLIARPAPSTVLQPLADFLPVIPSVHAILRATLSSPVQVIVRIQSRYYRHTPALSSLCIDRTSLILTVDWRELFNSLLHMPDQIRLEKERQAWPSRVWIPRRVSWVTRSEEDGYDSDSMSVADTESIVGHVLDEERDDDDLLQVHISIPATESEIGSVSQGDGHSLGVASAFGLDDVEFEPVPSPVTVVPPTIGNGLLVAPAAAGDEGEEGDDGALTELTEVLLPSSPFHPDHSPHSPDAVRGFSHDAFLAETVAQPEGDEYASHGSVADDDHLFSFEYEEKQPDAPSPSHLREAPVGTGEGYGFSLLGEYEDSPPRASEGGADEDDYARGGSPAYEYNDTHDLPPYSDLESMAGTERDGVEDLHVSGAETEGMLGFADVSVGTGIGRGEEDEFEKDDDDEPEDVFFSPLESPRSLSDSLSPPAVGGEDDEVPHAATPNLPAVPPSPAPSNLHSPLDFAPSAIPDSPSSSPSKSKKTYRSIGIQVSLLASRLSPIEFLLNMAKRSSLPPGASSSTASAFHSERVRAAGLGRYASWP